MCCFLLALLLAGPRIGILVWWLIDPLRWQLVFPSFILPVLGFLFLPWTTIAYVFVAPGGILWFDWVWIALGLLADASSYGGSAYKNRERLEV